MNYELNCVLNLNRNELLNWTEFWIWTEMNFWTELKKIWGTVKLNWTELWKIDELAHHWSESGIIDHAKSIDDTFITFRQLVTSWWALVGSVGCRNLFLYNSVIGEQIWTNFVSYLYHFTLKIDWWADNWSCVHLRTI